MKKIKDWGIFAKIFWLVLLVLFPIVLYLFIYLMPQVSANFMKAKQDSNKNLVEVAVSAIKYYTKLQENNVLTKSEAQTKALEAVKSLRYDESNYFWINDLEPKMIMHPIKSELNGTDLSNNKDPNGKALFVEMVKVVRENSYGFVDYMWSKPGSNKPVSKISYVYLIKEWGWIIGSGIYVDDVEEQIFVLYIQIIIGLVIVISLALTLAYFFGKKLTAPIKTLQDAANRVALGDVDFQLEDTSQDEFGHLQRSFTKMMNNIKEKASIADKVSQGELNVEVVASSDKDILSKSMAKLVVIVKELIKDLKLLTDSALQGELQKRGDASKYSGGFKEIVEGINSTLDAVILPIQDGTGVLNKMAKGDLTLRVEKEYQGDHRKVKESINELGESLSHIVNEVQSATEATASASHEISSSTEEMSSGAQELSAQTSDVASAIEEMARTITETTKNTSMAADTAKQTGTKALDGGKAVDETIKGMMRISQVVNESANTVETLGKSSNQIGEIVQVINEIADQTNLLALNAAIEAARAGEQGRGFAVVADEVRKLAERTTKATKEIAEMIRQIQHDTNEAVNAMQNGKKEVENGTVLAQRAGISLKDIIAGTDEVLRIITQVAAASEEQSSAAEQISKSIEGINSVTLETTAGIQQIAKAADDLSNLTIQLQKTVSLFKVTDKYHALSNKTNTTKFLRGK